MSVQIVPLREDHTSAVVALSLRAWAPVFASLEGVLGSTIFLRLHPDWRVDQQRAVEATLADDEATRWVATVDDEVAGWIAVTLDPARRIGEIAMLAVDPDHQGQATGLKVTQFAVGWIRDAGMTVAMVQTGGDPGHAPARRTYEKAEFSLLPAALYFQALGTGDER